MPLSVLFVTAMYPHEERPGCGSFVKHQAEQLRALGHHVDVVLVEGYVARSRYVTSAGTVFLATWRKRYDLVHVHYGLTGISALGRWRTPMVVTLHGSDILEGRLQPLVSKLVSALADATIVVSPEIRDRCRGTLIPCGVDLEVFHPVDRTDARLSLGLTPTTKYVLFPFAPERRVKRYDLASDAVSLLRERGTDVSLLPVWAEPSERMPLYYSAADVMLLCSDSEGSPTSMKEALACNLPVVSTDVGDVRTILRDVEGTEICDQTPNSIAMSLARVFERNARVSFDGRTAMRRYDQAATVGAVLRVYESVRRAPR